MKNKKVIVFILSLTFLLSVAVSGTLAYIYTSTEEIKNEFKPSEVTCDVEEDLENNVKSNVNVRNKGDIHAYVRVNLISHRINPETGNIIGGTAEIPEFIPGKQQAPAKGEWFKGPDGYYYYSQPVAPQQTPEVPLIGKPGILLHGSYAYVLNPEDNYKLLPGTDADGGVQVIEVMAEAVQADGGVTEGDKFIPAVEKAWGTDETEFSVAPDGTLSVSAKQ